MAFRIRASLVFSMLLALVILWGGCIWCPQYFMLPVADEGCCDETGRCKKDSKEPAAERECQTMPLELQAARGKHSRRILFAAAELPNALIATTLPVITLRERSEAAQRGHSPPDLQALYATFLI